MVAAVSCRETLWLLSQRLTVVPTYFDSYWNEAEALTSSVLASFPSHNPVHQVLGAYMHLAGIEAGYGYFAPNVPDSYKLVFELHYPDGRVEYDLPHIGEPASGLRLDSLLDAIVRARSEGLRQIAIQMMVDSIKRDHPQATFVRAVLGAVRPRSVYAYEAGQERSYEFLYAYDFVFPQAGAQTRQP